jgi:conjugative transposon TraM protein
MGDTGKQGSKNRNKMTGQTFEHSEQFLKRRKFLTVLPVIVVPFVTVVFWLLGGGSNISTNPVSAKTGLNTQLPDAKIKSQSALDKLSFYAMADRDSVKRNEQMRMDPNYSAVPVLTKPVGNSQRLNTSIGKRAEAEQTEESINQKISLLQKRISEPVPKKVKLEPADDERTVQSITHKESDPEMDAINNTLEKLLDVQHPERVKERLVEKKGIVYAVTTGKGVIDDSFFGRDGSARNTFFSSGDANDVSTAPGAIPAVVHGSQTMQSGFVVKLRLLKDVFVNGSKIEAGSFVFGRASFEDERMKVEISSIQFEKNLFPVALKVYDMDGIEGIYIPGSASREVVKQSGDQAIQSVGIVNMDPSLKAQAAAAGIGAAKSLLSKKVKQVRVTVKANYMVLLKDVNQK